LTCRMPEAIVQCPAVEIRMRKNLRRSELVRRKREIPMIEPLSDVSDVVSLLVQLDMISASTAHEIRGSASALTGSAEALLDDLVATKSLTSFQRSAIQAGKARSLRKGNYLLLDEIGEGGMGVVYKARHVRMERTVALKTLRSDRRTAADDHLRFRREVLTAAKLRHPNIVTAYDADELDGELFLVMEFVDGMNFAQWSRSSSRLPVTAILNAITQAATGLQHAHDHGTVHRDIKPANLIRTEEGMVKILDLGLARAIRSGPVESAHPDGPRTEVGTILGTVAFMAPEQAMQSSVDARADIYALGCTLYFLFTGCPPFSADTAFGLLTAHRSAPIPVLGAVRPGLPHGLQSILNRMLAKSPQDRFSSMSELISAISRLDVDQSETVITGLESPDSIEAVSTAANRADATRSAVPRAVHENQGKNTVPPVGKWRRLAEPARWGAWASLLVLVGIVLKIRTPDGEVTVESPRNDLHVSMKGERTFSVGTNDETEQLSATTSHEGMKVTAGNISALTRDIVVHSGTDREIRLTMAPQSELPTEMPPAVTDQQTFDLRLRPLIESDSQIADWTKKLSADTNDALAQTCRGNRLNEIGRSDLAMFDHLEAVRKQPNLAVAWSNLGHSYQNHGQSDEALDAWTKAIQRDPDEAVYRSNRAMSLLKLQRLEESLSDLDVAAKLAPKELWIWNNRAEVLVALNRHDEALGDLTAAARINPLDPVGWILRAQYFVGQSRLDEAVSDYSTAIQLNPSNAAWRGDRARYLIQLNRFADAIADLDEAIRLDPEQPQWLEERGAAHLKHNMRKKAIADFVAAWKIDASIQVPPEILEEVNTALQK